MTIERIQGAAKGRARATRHGGLVYAVATDPDSALSVAEQTRNTLALLEKNLIDGGSDKTRIVQATVYLTDIANKAEMDELWCEWIGGPENWPQRACVGTQLAGKTLVEIVAVATAK